LSTFLNDESKALVKLGLSPSQSKIYLATLQLGKATVRDISQVSKIAREDIYKFMPSLVALGLITKHLCSPIQYEAIEPTEVFKLLFGRIEKEYLDLEIEADKALKSLTKNLSISDNVKKSLDTTFLSATENIKMLTEAAKEAKETIDFTTRYNLFVYSMNSSQFAQCVKEMRKATKRGVKFRMLLDKPVIAKPVSNLSFQVSDSKPLVLDQNFEYKYLNSAPKCVVIIYDNKRCLIETSKEQDMKVSPFLWSNNDILVELCKTYFEKYWNTAYKPLENLTNNGASKERKRKSRDTDASQVACV
jgi:sugar-specific transcriptional regulator TrmB